MKSIVLPASDYVRIKSILEQMRKQGKLHEPHLLKLAEEIKTAQELPAGALPNDVVSIHSTVRYQETATMESATVTLVFPAEKDKELDKISVFSPLGAALLGEREGNEVRVSAPGGVFDIRVEKVVFQPEAAGVNDY